MTFYDLHVFRMVVNPGGEYIVTRQLKETMHVKVTNCTSKFTCNCH